MSSTAKPITGEGSSIIVTVYIAPKDVDEFTQGIQKVFDIITQNPDCVFFQVYRDAEDPGVFHWVEDWAKPAKEVFAKEHKKEYFLEYIKKTEPMWVKPREIKWVEKIGPSFTFSKIPVTGSVL